MTVVGKAPVSAGFCSTSDVPSSSINPTLDGTSRYAVTCTGCTKKAGGARRTLPTITTQSAYKDVCPATGADACALLCVPSLVLQLQVPLHEVRVLESQQGIGQVEVRAQLTGAGFSTCSQLT